MAQDLQTLVVSLSADIKRYENALNKAQGITNKNAQKIEKRFSKMNSTLGSSFGGLGAKLAGVFAGTAIARGAVKFSDAATRIDNSLKVAGLSGAKLDEVYGKLRDSALKNSAPLEDLATLYGRASLAAKDLGATQEQLVKFTDNVALALKVGGKSAEESSGALLQLSQAVSGSVIQAQEYNSLIDGAPALLQAVAAGMKETGGSVAALTRLVKDGKVSSRAFFDAFEAGAPILAEKVKDVDVTFGQAMENFQTALIDTAREFNNSTGASKNFAGGLNNIARSIADFDTSGFIQKIQEANGAVETFLNNVGNADVFKKLAQALGAMDENGNAFNPDFKAAQDKTATLEKEVKDLQAVIENNTKLGFDTTDAMARLVGIQSVLAQIRGEAANISETLPNPSKGDLVMKPTLGTKDDAVGSAVTPISLADPKYTVPTTPKKPKKTGSKSTPKTADDRIGADIQSIKDRTEALRVETELVGQSFVVQEQRKMALDLEQSALADLREEARKKGQTDLDSIKLGPEQVAQINAVSTAYAQQADELRKVQDTQDKAEQAAGEFYDTFKGGVIDAITGAESLSDALSGVLKKLGDMLLNAAFDSLFKPASGNSSGGAFGSLFSGLTGALGFASGGYTGSGGKNQIAGAVHKGEYVFDAESTKRIGVDNLRKMQGYAQGGLVGAPRMPTLKGGSSIGGGGNFTFAPVIDARGADADAVTRLEQVVAKQAREFDARAVQAIRKANNSNMKLR